jgi:hypothetical protein
VLLEPIVPHACPVKENPAVPIKIPEVLQGNLAPGGGFSYYLDLQVSPFTIVVTSSNEPTDDEYFQFSAKNSRGVDQVGPSEWLQGRVYQASSDVDYCLFPSINCDILDALLLIIPSVDYILLKAI